MAVLKVAQIGNPALRNVARLVDERMLADEALQRLVADMVDTMREYGGVGLAAPQVREGIRAFVMEIGESERYPDRDSMPLLAVLNPEIEVLDPVADEDWEGCLSIAGLRGRVPRARTVRLRALDPRGEPFAVDLEGFAARVAQHEADHLDGVVYLDRMADLSSLSDEHELRRERLRANQEVHHP